MTTVHSAAPDHAAQSLAPNEVVPMLIGSTVGEIERELVLQTQRFDGNRTHAARVLGLSVRTCVTRSGNIQPRERRAQS